MYEASATYCLVWLEGVLPEHIHDVGEGGVAAHGCRRRLFVRPFDVDVLVDTGTGFSDVTLTQLMLARHLQGHRSCA